MLRHNENQKTELCRNNGFLCCDIAYEVPEEVPELCCDIKSIVMTRMEDRRQ